MAEKQPTEEMAVGPDGSERGSGVRLPAEFAPPRIVTYRAEDLAKKDLVIHAGSPGGEGFAPFDDDPTAYHEEYF